MKDRFGSTEISAANETRRETLYGAVLEDAADGEGVMVVESGTGALGQTGVPSGTRIQSVDGAPVDSTEDLMAAVEKAKEAGQKAVLIEGLTQMDSPPGSGWASAESPQDSRILKRWLAQHSESPCFPSGFSSFPGNGPACTFSNPATASSSESSKMP